MREFNLATLSTGARGYATHLNIQVRHSHATDQDFRSVVLFVYSLRCVRLTNHVWAGFSWMQVTVHREHEIGRMHWPKIQSQKPPAIVWQWIGFSLVYYTKITLKSDKQYQSNVWIHSHSIEWEGVSQLLIVFFVIRRKDQATAALFQRYIIAIIIKIRSFLNKIIIT